MTRPEQINKGLIWQVYPDKDDNNIFFEGTKSKCLKYIKDNFGMRMYKNGTVRIARVIWEKE